MIVCNVWARNKNWRNIQNKNLTNRRSSSASYHQVSNFHKRWHFINKWDDFDILRSFNFFYLFIIRITGNLGSTNPVNMHVARNDGRLKFFELMGTVAENFGQKGKGTQYSFTDTFKDMSNPNNPDRTMERIKWYWISKSNWKGNRFKN